MTEVVMPRLSDSMEEGTVLSWLIGEGQPVKEGDELVEIETDKAAMTHHAEASGVLQIIVAEGETVRVGEPIARLGASSDAPASGNGAAADAGVPEPAAEPAPEAPAAVADGPAVSVPRGSGPPSTPLARRVAAIQGVALDGVEGTGPRGRITKLDVLRAAGLEPSAPLAPPPLASPPLAPADAQPAPALSAKGGSRVEQLSRLQATIARRMAESKATVPHFQVQTEVVMDAAVRLRAELKEVSGLEVVPSFNDMIVKASALALREHPRANGSYRDESFHLHESVNVGVAVAADDALIVPTIFDADEKSLTRIAGESRALAERVRSGAITPPELAGGTFTVSNLGMFGMTAIVPVINPPQAAILGVGAVRDVLVRGEAGDVIDRSLMTLTLSCDHRILYGADAARFLSEIRGILESPLRLVF